MVKQNNVCSVTRLEARQQTRRPRHTAAVTALIPDAAAKARKRGQAIIKCVPALKAGSCL